MSPRTSGLERDFSLVRRRGWVFAPFLLVGVAAALLLGSGSATPTAMATMQLEAMVHGLPAGAERGLRVADAHAMAGDEGFRRKVREAIGEPNFNFARYGIELTAVSVADGSSRGTMTVSISDRDRTEAERLRDAFVTVYSREYLQPDGQFRRQFIDRQRRTAEAAESELTAKYAELQRVAAARGIDDFQLLIPPGGHTRLLGDLSVQVALISRQLAEVDGALTAINGGVSGGAAAAIVSSILGQPVAAEDALAALMGKQEALLESLRLLNGRQATLSEASLDPELRRLVEEVRALGTLKDEGYARLANATIAVESSETRLTVARSISEDAGRSLAQRVAVALAVTIVFGLIAIYLLEWLSQIRAGIQD